MVCFELYGGVFTFANVVTDPVLGERWFLGNIFRFAREGNLCWCSSCKFWGMGGRRIHLSSWVGLDGAAPKCNRPRFS